MAQNYYFVDTFVTVCTGKMFRPSVLEADTLYYFETSNITKKQLKPKGQLSKLFKGKIVIIF